MTSGVGLTSGIGGGSGVGGAFASATGGISGSSVSGFGGTIQERCNRDSVNTIVDNNIGPKTKIQITRSGDVIPYIVSVIEGTYPQLPDIP